MEDETDFNEGIKDIPADRKFIRFSIKADATEENAKVHESFKDFCKVECDNNYTIGLRTLLTYYMQDGKIISIMDSIHDMKKDILELKTKKTEDKKEDKGMF